MSFRKALLVFCTLSMTLGTSVAMAAEGGSSDPFANLASGLCIAIAAFGGALGQGKTAASALEGIARNPAAQGKIFVPMIIGLALIESLVLYAFVIAFVKIH
ncbi:ATP synthase F0 subunit C [Bdellovibrionota bacterium FG-1]